MSILTQSAFICPVTNYFITIWKLRLLNKKVFPLITSSLERALVCSIFLMVLNFEVNDHVVQDDTTLNPLHHKSRSFSA
jgi:hypothetical protein